MKKKILILTIIMVLSMFGMANAVEFNDVPTNHWAYNDIKAMSDAGIINGRGNGAFDPNSQVTKEEFFAMTSRIIQSTGTHPIENPFFVPYLADEVESYWSAYDYWNLSYFVVAKNWYPTLDIRTAINELRDYSENFGGMLGSSRYAKVVDSSRNWMQYFIMGYYSEDIVNNEVTARYKGLIRRDQAAALLGFFLADSSITDKNVKNIKDWDATYWKYYVNEAIERDIFRGSNDNNGALCLRPGEGLSRAEAAALLNRFYQQARNI